MYHNGQKVLRFYDTSSEGFWPVLCGPGTVLYLNNAFTRNSSSARYLTGSPAGSHKSSSYVSYRSQGE